MSLGGDGGEGGDEVVSGECGGGARGPTGCCGCNGGSAREGGEGGEGGREGGGSGGGSLPSMCSCAPIGWEVAAKAIIKKDRDLVKVGLVGLGLGPELGLRLGLSGLGVFMDFCPKMEVSVGFGLPMHASGLDSPQDPNSD